MIPAMTAPTCAAWKNRRADLVKAFAARRSGEERRRGGSFVGYDVPAKELTAVRLCDAR
jgi:hypothetical protein